VPVHGLDPDRGPDAGDGQQPDRVQVRSYPGGHMFYSRADSQAAFRKDVQALFQRN
jgi:carboxypeptidase C (cathepsin A)